MARNSCHANIMASLLKPSISEESKRKKQLSLSLAIRHVVKHMCSMTLKITAI